MRFESLGIPGAWQIELERRIDDRGWFARIFCAEEMAAQGIPTAIVQENVSYNSRRGTLRGLHLQLPPHAEGKHVRCTRGRIFDVLVDLRPESETHRQWIGVELSAEAGTTLYAPPGLAHGFLTLSDDVEVEYRMTAPYVPSATSGVRWNDPAFGIDWPELPREMSETDANWPDYTA